MQSSRERFVNIKFRECLLRLSQLSPTRAIFDEPFKLEKEEFASEICAGIGVSGISTLPLAKESNTWAQHTASELDCTAQKN